MQIFSHAQKHRLKMAAKLLRKGGARFEEGNFYEAVIDAVNNMDDAKRETLVIPGWAFRYIHFREVGSTEPYPTLDLLGGLFD